MTTWTQANLHLAATASETVLTTSILPILNEAAPSWFFIRKDPLRLRWQTADETSFPADIAAALDALVPEQVTAWNPAIYEPETEAFGGADAMAASHVFFTADSRHLATALTDHDFATHRATYSTLLIAHLMRAARLDWWEQGDVWKRMADMRPKAPPPSAAWSQRLHTLITRDPWHRPTPRLTPHREWFDAAQQLGETLAHLTALGRTSRGLRAILAHHLLFHWNRIGLPTALQALLATTARNTVFGTATEAHS